MVGKSAQIVIFALLTGLLSACSTIKSFFPDKTKDYQYAQELPPLELPEHIKAEAKIQDRPVILSKPYPGSTFTQTEQTVNKSQTENHSAEKPLYVPVELIEYDAGATRLRIYQPVEKAWRYVGKALSHESIEITHRDQTDFSYTVQYDPHARKAEDGALWDELVFFFGDDPSKEKPYQIRLVPRNSELTDVIVVDDKEQPVRQGDGLTLLKLLKTTINNDLARP
jgi:outer membrane protein assembly factor BamC